MDSEGENTAVPTEDVEDLLELQPTITSINDKGELQTMAGPTLAAPSNVSLSALKKLALKELGLANPGAGDPENQIGSGSEKGEAASNAEQGDLEQPGEQREPTTEPDVGGQPSVFLARSRCRPQQRRQS